MSFNNSEPMTPKIIIKHENWPLLERFCREQGPVPPEDGRDFLRIISDNVFRYVYQEEEQTAMATALTALFASCPALLERNGECSQLLLCFLSSGDAARAILRPCVESLGRRPVSMDWLSWRRWGFRGLPELWHSLLPDGPVLAAGRWSIAFDPCFILMISGHSTQTAEILRYILDTCPVVGDGKKGGLSSLAQSVLCYGDVPLIVSLFQQPDGLLATEDPDTLIDFVLRSSSVSRTNRAAALSHVRREVDYDL